MRSLSRVLGILAVTLLATPIFAQSLQEIRTERVQILFYPEDEAAAQEVASFADQVTEQLTEILDYSPTELIPVILRGAPDQANGYYTIGPRRVVLMVSPDFRYPGYFGPAQSWLRLVFTHELVHYIQLSKPMGLPGIADTLFGEAFHGALGAGAFPGWFVEGTAVYLETLLTQGGRGRSGAFATEILASFYDLDSWTYGQAAYDSLAEFDSRIYRSGYILVDYLANNYGFSLLNELQEAVWTRSSKNNARGFDEHLARLTGLSNDELWSRAQRAFLSRYWSALDVTPGIPWEGWTSKNRVFPRPSLPVSYLDGYLLSYKDAWNPTRFVGVTEDSQDRIPIDVPNLDLAYPGDFDLAGSALVFAHREYPLRGPEPSNSTARLYIKDLSDSGLPRALTPAEGPDYRSPTVAFVPGDSPTAVPAVYALERRGSAHALVQVLPDSRTLYFANTRLGSARVSPDGRTLALTEYYDGYSRLVFLDSSSGEISSSSTPWTRGSWEFPRWYGNEGVALVLDYDGTRVGVWAGLEGGLPRSESQSALPVPAQPGQPASASSSTAQFHVIARDPVGVLGVMILDDGRVLYQTQRSKSIQLLVTELKPEVLELRMLNEQEPDFAGPAFQIDPVRSGLFLHSWTPTVAIRPSAFGTQDFFLDFDLSLGAALFLGNLSENRNSVLQAGWFLRSGQPSLDLVYIRSFGPRAELGVQVLQAYESRWVQYAGSAPVAEGRQTSAASIQWAQIFGRSSRPGWTSELRSTIGLSGQYLIEGRREFDLSDSFTYTRPLASSFPGSTDPEVLLGRPLVAVSSTVSALGWAPSGQRDFYGGSRVSASFSGRVEPDLTGLTAGVPSLIAQTWVKGAVPGPFQTLGSLELGATLANSLTAPSYGGYSGSFTPTLGMGDGRLQVGAGLSGPLFFPEFSLGSLVIDKVGFTVKAEWGASVLAPSLRSSNQQARVVAQDLWARDTGSAVGAPGTLDSGEPLPSWTRASGFYADTFLSLALTVDLGVGAWAGYRPLMQAGIEIKIPLNSAESSGIAPVFLMDLGDLL